MGHDDPLIRFEHSPHDKGDKLVTCVTVKRWVAEHITFIMLSEVRWNQGKGVCAGRDNVSTVGTGMCYPNGDGSTKLPFR